MSAPWEFLAPGVECPISTCTERFTVGEVPPAPPALASALGISSAGLEGVWSFQAAEKLERELASHLRVHLPQEWVPELMAVRRALSELLEYFATPLGPVNPNGRLVAHVPDDVVARARKAVG